jgi:hypothetical protein
MVTRGCLYLTRIVVAAGLMDSGVNARLEARALGKLLLHVGKHAHADVNGALIGTVSGQVRERDASLHVTWTRRVAFLLVGVPVPGWLVCPPTMAGG